MKRTDIGEVAGSKGCTYQGRMFKLKTTPTELRFWLRGQNFPGGVAKLSLDYHSTSTPKSPTGYPGEHFQTASMRIETCSFCSQ